MPFRLLPLEKRDGEWRVRILPLALWVTLFNLAFMAVVYWWPAGPPGASWRVPARPMTHPVVVISREAALRTSAADTAHQLLTLHRGDTVDLYVAQPAGWYFVTRPDDRPVTDRRPGYNGGVSGYVRQPALQVPDSTLDRIRQQQ